MNIIKASVEILDNFNESDVLKKIEQAGRVCYKSEGRIEKGTAAKFVAGLINRKHLSVLEHFSFSVRFICDRGVTHEIVRHRLASYSQESTRYCNYSQDKFGEEITVIEPCYLDKNSDNYDQWKSACLFSEMTYFRMLCNGATPQEARAVLPNSLKTEIVMTANLREWRHFLELRTSTAAHPQMREVACELSRQLKEKAPVLFSEW